MFPFKLEIFVILPLSYGSYTVKISPLIANNNILKLNVISKDFSSKSIDTDTNHEHSFKPSVFICVYLFPWSDVDVDVVQYQWSILVVSHTDPVHADGPS